MIMPLPGVGRHPYISVLKKNVFEVATSGNICKVLVTNGSLKWYLTTVKASLLSFMIFKKEKKKVKRNLKQIIPRYNKSEKELAILYWKNPPLLSPLNILYN